MGVNHRGFYILMPQSFLDSSNIVAILWIALILSNPISRGWR